MLNVILYPLSLDELLDRYKFIDVLSSTYGILKRGDAKCVRVILDKDDSSHRLPILVSFTYIDDEERRIRTDIPKDANCHVFINETELAKVKKYDAVEAAADFVKFLILMERFENSIHRNNAHS